MADCFHAVCRLQCWYCNLAASWLGTYRYFGRGRYSAQHCWLCCHKDQAGKSKDIITRAAGDKSTSDVSDDTSPKISTTVDIEEQHNVKFAQ